MEFVSYLLHMQYLKFESVNTFVCFVLGLFFSQNAITGEYFLETGLLRSGNIRAHFIMTLSEITDSKYN